MVITNATAPYQGMAAENVFFVSNDNKIPVGTGYIVEVDQSTVYPEMPDTLYINIESQQQGRNLLFGALLARAEQIKAMKQDHPVRLYASLPANQTEMIRFYEECGLKMDDGEDLYTFAPIPGSQRAPMGMTYGSVQLDSPALRAAFLERINYARLTPFDDEILTYWMRQPHFMALGFYQGSLPVCELLATGEGDGATLMHVYTLNEFRRKHYATQLIGAACQILQGQGVSKMYAHVLHRNTAQMELMKKLNAQFIKTETAMPGMVL